MSENLKKTPLHSFSLKAKAKFTDFAGWEMAVQYSSLKLEHQAVRETVGMFDISHMGKFQLQGQNLRSQIEYLIPSHLSHLKAGQAQYSVLLNEQGGIVDDIIFYYQGIDSNKIESGVMIVNASTCSKDWAWLQQHLSPSGIELIDNSDHLALIALQGKKAVDSLQSFFSVDLNQLSSFGHLTINWHNEIVFIARTGYTGEDGFEIMVSPHLAQNLWLKLTSQGVTPCGLGARDTLRLEACMSLYGQEITEKITPLEAGLGWLVNVDDGRNFIGKDILVRQKKEGVSKRLVALEGEGRYIPRHDYPLIKDDKTVGIVTSGTLSPTLGKPIALGYLPVELAKVGQSLQVEIRGKLFPLKVVKKPFYNGKILNR
ncbi:MAG: glycine cleavage system aminomethyltransferase GcvT [Cyanobacterium sp. T60_A2020_053]|nr:glycine cleavage system aminomethyltransferase GcvT [Cyanobacterium sp. T60_A2020_053]